MSDITMDEISIQIEGNSDKAVESLTRLTQILDNLTGVSAKAISGLKSINREINDTSKKSQKSNKKTEDSFTRLIGIIGTYAAGYALVKKAIMGNVNSMANYISSVNRFNATFSVSEKVLKDTTKWVNDLSKAWVLDEKIVADTISRYYNMITTMGMSNDESLRMSKNLTMLTQDLAAFWGVQNTEVMNRIASAMRGEAEGLAQYGISLNQATLQATLYAEGINRTVSSLNSAEKAELVYYQIMKSTAKYHGYHAKTILQPANALQILSTQFTKLGRAIGSIFLPPLMAIIPYIIAITELITKLAKSIASLFGFDLGEWTSGTSDFSAGLDGIGDSASQAGKKVKGMIADFDELHTIDFGDPTGSGTGIGVGGGGLGLDASQFEYSSELMDYVNEKLEYARKKIEDIKDFIGAIGLAIAGFTISRLVLGFFNKLFDWNLSKGNLILKSIGVGLVLGGSYLTYKGITKMLDGDITWQDILQVMSGMATIAGGVLLLTGGNIALSVGITLLLTGISAIVNGITENNLISTVIGSLTAAIGIGTIIGKAKNSFKIGLKASLLLSIAALEVSLAVSIGYWWNEYFEEEKQKLYADKKELNLWELIRVSFSAVGAGALKSIGIKDEIDKWLSDPQIKETIQTKVSGFLETAKTALKYGLPGVGLIFATWDLWTEYIEPMVNDAFLGWSWFLDDMGDSIETWWTEDASPWFTKEKWEELWGNIKEAGNTKWNEFVLWWKTTAIYKWWTDNVAPWFTTEKWKNLVQKAIDGIKNKFNQWKNNFNIIKNWWDEKIAPWFTFEKWRNLGQNVIDGLTSKINELKNKSIHFDISWDTDSWGAKALQKLGFQGVPNIKIGYYAEGGFPTAGDLFIANESGPEWVGSMNGRTAVANKDQISTGIEEASYRGMSRALKEYGFSGVVVKNFMDSKEIASKITQINKQNANMYG